MPSTKNTHDSITFVSQGILHNKQFGFRKNHSTTHALNYSISQIKNACTQQK